MKSCKIQDFGKFTYVGKISDVQSNFPMHFIRMAWDHGCSFEQEADGYGAGAGTNGDWSGIRDSSHEAKEIMFQKANNFIEDKLGRE
jgi:hypothetical protein